MPSSASVGDEPTGPCSLSADLWDAVWESGRVSRAFSGSRIELVSEGTAVGAVDGTAEAIAKEVVMVFSEEGKRRAGELGEWW